MQTDKISAWFTAVFVCVSLGVLGCTHLEPAQAPAPAALEDTSEWKAFREAWDQYEAHLDSHKGLEIRKKNVALLENCIEPLWGLRELVRRGLIQPMEVRAIADVVVSRLSWEVQPNWQTIWDEVVWQEEEYQHLREKMPLLEDLATLQSITPWTKKYFVKDCRESFYALQKVTPETVEQWRRRPGASFKEVSDFREHAAKVFAAIH